MKEGTNKSTDLLYLSQYHRHLISPDIEEINVFGWGVRENVCKYYCVIHSDSLITFLEVARVTQAILHSCAHQESNSKNKPNWNESQNNPRHGNRSQGSPNLAGRLA